MEAVTIKSTVLKSYLDLMAEYPFHQVSMRMVADASGITLSELRATFASEEDLFTAFAESIDCAMLDRMAECAPSGGPRERVLGAMMARLHVLAPFKEAVRSLLIGASRDPATTLFFNRVSIEEHKWTLIAADLDHRGAQARNLAEAVSLAFVAAAAVWLDEKDDALPRTRAVMGGAFAYSDATLAAFEINKA